MPAGEHSILHVHQAGHADIERFSVGADLEPGIFQAGNQPIPDPILVGVAVGDEDINGGIPAALLASITSRRETIDLRCACGQSISQTIAPGNGQKSTNRLRCRAVDWVGASPAGARSGRCKTCPYEES
jgi:hypothetical protein